MVSEGLAGDNNRIDCVPRDSDAQTPYFELLEAGGIQCVAADAEANSVDMAVGLDALTLDDVGCGCGQLVERPEGEEATVAAAPRADEPAPAGVEAERVDEPAMPLGTKRAALL